MLVSKETRDALKALGRKGESYDTIIQHLLLEARLRRIEKEQKADELSEWIVSGLVTDGAHHKQWYLEKVLEEVMGEAYVKTMRDENGEWEKGVPP